MTRIPQKYRFKIIVLLLVFCFSVVILFLLNTGEKLSPTKNSVKVPDKLNFLVIGDSGTGSTEQMKIRDLLLKEGADLMIHTGDVAYQRGAKEEVQKNVIDVYRALFSELVFYPSFGNHDYGTDSGQPLADAFVLPNNERYYSFKQKNALFIALDTNTPLDQNPQQMLSWLEQTLKAREDSVRWVFVYFHHPPYTTNGRHKSDRRVLERIVPVLEKYKVDVVFSGHEHNYQRSCKILSDSCQDGGITYIVSGGGGAPLYPTGPFEWFSSYQKSVHHYLLAEVEDCDFSIKAIDIEHQVFDTFKKNKC